MSNFDDIAAFPLCWPEGWDRTKSRKDSKFGSFSVYDAIHRHDGLLEELRLMGARNVIVSTSIPLRRDGLPLAKPPVDGDPGAAVYFMRKGKPLCLACDQYNAVACNIRAITKSIEALRGLERWGSTDLLDRAFTGFAALPARVHWSEVLGLPRDARMSAIESAYRARAKKAHPDVEGGSHEAMSALNAAYEEAKAEVQP